ncbi:MAG: hypothetical protein ACHQM6_03970 [Candidatus Kapaibacterium sp.]
MQKAKKTIYQPGSPLLRAISGVIALLLITVKLASPLLHTHQLSESSRSEISTTNHCDACDYEATQATESGVAVVLPVNLFKYISKAFEHESIFLSAIHSSSESRGPPTIS